MNINENDTSYDIAIIGMSGRFPQANDLDAFWDLLKEGREAITPFSDEILEATGVEPSLLQHASYVKSGTVINGIADFDANFFEMSARDAEITDPQQRLFMEVTWEALEQAGYPPENTDASIGLYAGVSDNTYLRHCIETNEDLVKTVGAYRIFTLSGKDFLATRTAYKLNLTGPAVTIQTACSTSLVAAHVACQSLLNMECDLALAGGASINVPQEQGYLYQEGMITSPDGHCRPFDAQAQGTTLGCGVGVVLLKRLDEALNDGDTIHAVIKGSAINNDGADKIGYTAPSVRGQADVIADAQAVADVHPDEIQYIETHGTGTPLGDPIEIQALTQAFRTQTEAKNYCAIASLKSNIGHADAAAGIAGLLKTVLVLKHQQIPPSLHYQQPNPQIDFANSPFFVNQELAEWKSPPNNLPRCAGVSSFGVGGTNAHMIVAEAPTLENETHTASRQQKLLVLSAKTATALETATENLTQYFKQTDAQDRPPLADIAYTLSCGRQAFSHRRFLLCTDHKDAEQQLIQAAHLPTLKAPESQPNVAFLLPGQGAQYANMTRGFYETEVLFKTTVDECAVLLKPHLDCDIRDVLYPEDSFNQRTDTLDINQTALTQPALFVVEYALAKLWMAWGIQPKALLGHSIGEYVAACLADVFSLEDALFLMATRGRLIQTLPQGDMLSVPLSEAEAKAWCSDDISLAVVNGKARCVLAGSPEAIKCLQIDLHEEGIESKSLQTSHAFHSHLLEPILMPFAEALQQIEFHSPQIPYLSNYSGTWITEVEATSPEYWLKHLRHTVRFADNLEHLLQHNMSVLLEVGPGNVLSSLVKQHPTYPSQTAITVASLPAQREVTVSAETRQLLHTLGQLWLQGTPIDWSAFYTEEQRRRVPLPTYPFERQRYWIDPPKHRTSLLAATSTSTMGVQSDIEQPNWLYEPQWVKKPLLEEGLDVQNEAQHYLLFSGNDDFSEQLEYALKQQGHQVSVVGQAMAFAQNSENHYAIDPQCVDDYGRLLKVLQETELPLKWVHCWTVTANEIQAGKISTETVLTQAESGLEQGFYSLLYLAQAVLKNNINDSIEINVVSNNLQAVIDGDNVQAEKASLLGVIKTIPQEIDTIHCRSIDIDWSSSAQDNDNNTVETLLKELLLPVDKTVVAYRQAQRWEQTYQSLPWQEIEPTPPIQRLRQQGVYLISGGLGGIGLSLAAYLAQQVQAKLVLIGRSAFPEKAQWQKWLSEHYANDEVAQQILELQRIEQTGAEVFVYCADSANYAQMQQVISFVKQQLGDIDGVIHAAGIADGALIANREREVSSQVLAPKVTGTLVFEQLLADQEKPLDFFISCSSLASIVGIVGQVAYCAANAFQDAFALARRHHPQTLYAAINWDTWQQVGMAVKAIEDDNNPLKSESDKVENRLSHGLFPTEGQSVFEQVLHQQKAQILVAKQGLQAVMENVQHLFEEHETANADMKKTPRPLLASSYIAPSNEQEQQLVDIWEKFLGVSPIGVEDDFFELGGDSLLAVQLANAIRTQLKVELNTQALINVSTISSLLVFMQLKGNKKASTAEPELLVEIQQGNTQNPPLVLVHPIGGYVFFYRELAQYLDPSQAVYGLRAQGIEGEKPPLECVEEMAALYIRHLQQRQPKGPYFLGGSSFGGMIAYEMAQQLQQQGEDIALLALIDTPGPEHMPIAKMRDESDVMAYVLAVGNGIDVSADTLRKMDKKARWEWFAVSVIGGNDQKSEMQSQTFFKLFDTSMKAMKAYQPAPWEGRALFFRALEQDDFNAKHPEKAWQKLISNLKVYPVSGNHITMNKAPHVGKLAQHLQQTIRHITSD